ncbi:MAG: DUF1080 domain-containing protein [Imperialibacter sp.]|uniref:3-keto-disaccharide hydrolase n=1 Tax=Imperialibacter sp. TaxID=2038411 RepID=UPI0032EB63CC
MKNILFSALAFLVVFGACAQVKEGEDPKTTEVWEPAVKKINPGAQYGAPPSDAIVLFDGKSLDKWESGKGGPAEWTVADGAVTVAAGKGVIQTKQKFDNYQLHIEWRAPSEVKGEGQGRGNSGVFMQGIYEVQVLDSYESRTYSNGQASSIYKQSPPLVNATRGPGEWQTYDIIYTAPVFNDKGEVVHEATVTVLHNGVVTQNHTRIWGNTAYIGSPTYKAHGKGPIMLQDHGNPVSFRNIWIREM